MRSKGDRATYIGHELESCRDFASLHYRLPFEKVRLPPPAHGPSTSAHTSFPAPQGYLVDWDAQKAVWDGLFSSHVFGVRA